MNTLINRLLAMIGKAAIKAADDSGGLQKVSVFALAGETRRNIARIQNFGFTSHPLGGAESVVLSAGGVRGNELVIACDDSRYRLAGLEGGDVAVYDAHGNNIVLSSEGIAVNASKVTVNCDDINLGGDGGAQVARIGDMVAVGGGSSAGNWPIVSGADNVKAV